MIVVGIYIKNSYTSEFERVELFNDEKISVTSSIQNINNIGATYSDFSQTFTIPATKNNNRLFKHWYENSLVDQFNTLTKSDAYIELDTIPFRVGKIQLEGCDVKENNPQSYSITFIGNLGSLKDKFAGLFLKDLTDSTEFNETYNGDIVRDKIFTTAASSDIMYPLISSFNYWTYGSGYDINTSTEPIYHNDLFPALRVKSVFKMIETQFGVTFTGDFLNDDRFKAAYLWLKNAEAFTLKGAPDLITWDSTADDYGYSVDLDTESFQVISTGDIIIDRYATITITPTAADKLYYVETYRNDVKILSQQRVSIIGGQTLTISGIGFGLPGDIYKVKIYAPLVMTFQATLNLSSVLADFSVQTMHVNKDIGQTTLPPNLAVANYMPEIKIEDFFSGILKMFNLTCFSSNGIDYIIDTLESYYSDGSIVDLTKYVKTDSINLNRVKTYKKINFLYEKSESLVNIGFLSANGIDYGNLMFDTLNEGDEYSIKLPFEDLNFNNLKNKLQVGYALKTDLQNYIPKPIILYDYNQLGLTALTDTTLYFSTGILGGGPGSPYTSYKAFGQEFNDGTNTYSLNFPDQQSTLTNVLITNSLYQTYYSKYIENIFNYRARLVKVSAILPISVLTSLKLNNRILIRDKRYIINSFTTDLTTGEATFELITDLRVI